jgi:hypothetical protein
MAPEMGAAPGIPVASWLAPAAAGVALVLAAATPAGTDPSPLGAGDGPGVPGVRVPRSGNYTWPSANPIGVMAR